MKFLPVAAAGLMALAAPALAEDSGSMVEYLTYDTLAIYANTTETGGTEFWMSAYVTTHNNETYTASPTKNSTDSIWPSDKWTTDKLRVTKLRSEKTNATIFWKDDPDTDYDTRHQVQCVCVDSDSADCVCDLDDLQLNTYLEDVLEYDEVTSKDNVTHLAKIDGVNYLFFNGSADMSDASSLGRQSSIIVALLAAGTGLALHLL